MSRTVFLEIMNIGRKHISVFRTDLLIIGCLVFVMVRERRFIRQKISSRSMMFPLINRQRPVLKSIFFSVIYMLDFVSFMELRIGNHAHIS